MPELPDYRLRLKAAIDRGPLSVRQVGARLAEVEGLKDKEAGRRQLYKYLDAKNPAEPEPERAATLAVILAAPELALVQPPAERRQARRAELEARVADLETLLNELVPRVDQLAGQVEALSKPAPSKRRPASKRAAR